ncbi:MAG: Flp pilus assembly complex ATPase component TadA [Lachnospiraceae bacterium]|jgi:twitching motility protein PilT|nr:Flp pilus assembly complex ATPase component TadA [Lachnospiraceae bacterium]
MPEIAQIRDILNAASKAHASDLHFIAGAAPTMRVHKRLHAIDYPILTAADILDIVLQIMSPTQREKFEVRGEFDFAFSTQYGRYRVHAYRQMGTVALAFRLVGLGIPTPQEAKIPDNVLSLSLKRRGLILVTGSAGSGKSTTLAVLIDAINRRREAHVVTLEDPVEYLHTHKRALISQREMGLDFEEYESALEAVLREDPDVIMIGELRTPAAIRGALSAAEAGYLVLGAMHTISASATIERICDAYGSGGQHQGRIVLSNVLEAMISQHLIATADATSSAVSFEVLNVDDKVRRMIRG